MPVDASAIAESTAFESTTFKVAVLIPVYNHAEAISTTLEQVLAHQLPVLLVDDGSDAPCREVLQKLSAIYSQADLLRLEQNSGKGAAVKAGFKWLQQQGYTHAIQVDADGQHNLNDLPNFTAAARNHPQAIIAGAPIYDDSVPKARLYGRYMTHIWIWINTLSLSIKDSLCGFRVYPLPAINELLQRCHCGDRMDFDPEIIVRWKWQNWPIININTQVHYPLDGISHFDVWRDNLRISKMHTRLFFGMLLRLPLLLSHKIKRPGHYG